MSSLNHFVARDGALSTELFRKGAYESAWLLYESRHYKTGTPFTRANIQLWNGEDLTNKTILLTYEQSLGEQIMFASMLKDLHKITKNIIVEVEDRLVGLFKRSFPFVRVIPFIVPWITVEADYMCPLGNIGRILRLSDTSFSKEPWLIPLNRDGINLKQGTLGLSWFSLAHNFKDKKSINFSLYKPIIENFNTVSVQYGYHKESIYSIPNLDITQNIDNLVSLISKCDKIITVSNVIGHIAGALGKETYVIISDRYGRFWYWEVPFYNTVKHFSKDENKGWELPIENILKILLDKN